MEMIAFTLFLTPIISIYLACCIRLSKAATQDTPKFKYYDSINWLVDMEHEYPLGILCSRLHLSFNHHRLPFADGENEDSKGQKSEPVSILIASPSDVRPGQHSPSDHQPRYHLGNRYGITVPVPTLPVQGDHSDGGWLIFSCELEEGRRLITLAESKVFLYDSNSLRNEKNGHRRGKRMSVRNRAAKIRNRQLMRSQHTTASVKDFSDPRLYFDENHWTCWISRSVPDRAILTNGQLADAEAILEYAQFQLHSASGSPKVQDAYGQPMERVEVLDRRIITERKQLSDDYTDRCRNGNHPLLSYASVKESKFSGNIHTRVVYAQAIPRRREIWSISQSQMASFLNSPFVERILDPHNSMLLLNKTLRLMLVYIIHMTAEYALSSSGENNIVTHYIYWLLRLILLSWLNHLGESRIYWGICLLSACGHSFVPHIETWMVLKSQFVFYMSFLAHSTQICCQLNLATWLSILRKNYLRWTRYSLIDALKSLKYHDTP